jgi:hypothetical protein
MGKVNQVNAAIEYLGNMVEWRPQDWPQEKHINCLSGMLNCLVLAYFPSSILP